MKDLRFTPVDKLPPRKTRPSIWKDTLAHYLSSQVSIVEVNLHGHPVNTAYLGLMMALRRLGKLDEIKVKRRGDKIYLVRMVTNGDGRQADV